MCVCISLLLVACPPLLWPCSHEPIMSLTHAFCLYVCVCVCICVCVYVCVCVCMCVGLELGLGLGLGLASVLYSNALICVAVVFQR